MNGWFFLVGAYVMVWGVLIFYLYSMGKKQRALMYKIHKLEESLKEGTEAALSHDPKETAQPGP